MYYLILLFLYPLSLLPFWILYFLSDLGFIVLYKIVGYRKKIVLENLQHAFPDKDRKELELIMDKFYHSFCDQWVETVKLLSIPIGSLNKRLECDWAGFNQKYGSYEKVYTLLGHQFNWEWCSLLGNVHLDRQVADFYLPLNSAAFNRVLYTIRSRAGAVLIPANNMRSGLRKIQNQKYMLAFIADQTPSNLKVADWFLFMNRPAPFLNGPEKMARKENALVVFGSVRKIKRGNYKLEFIEICDRASEMEPGMITKKYVALLQKELQEQPENWMWTHRRWKKIMPAHQRIVE